MKLIYLLLEGIFIYLLEGEYFTIPHIIDTILKFTRQLSTFNTGKKKLWIVSIIVEDLITSQGALDELNRHQIPCGKYKFKVSLCRWMISQITYF